MRRAIVSLWVVSLLAAACTPSPGSGNLFPTPPPGQSTTNPRQGTPTSLAAAPPFSADDAQRAADAIERAVLTLGLQPNVTYDADTERFSVVALGNTPLDNAKLAERIIRIVGDPDQPGAIELTHSQLRVRIRPDPDSERPCNCGFQ